MRTLTVRISTLGLGLVAVTLVALTGCRPVAGPFIAPPAAAPVPALPGALPSTPPADLELVIPSGTFAAEMRGEPTFVIPSRMSLTVGQSIVVRNEDQAMHYFFDIPIAPGQSFRKSFNQPGSFGFSPGLSCSLARDGSVTVEVRQP